MSQIRAKFKVSCIREETYHWGTTTRLIAEPVTGGSPENESFFEATPSGQMDIGVVRPEILAQLQPGQEFYVDITPIEK